MVGRKEGGRGQDREELKMEDEKEIGTGGERKERRREGGSE